MKVLKSDLPELTLKYRTTKNKKVKVSSSEDAFSLLQKLYYSVVVISYIWMKEVL